MDRNIEKGITCQICWRMLWEQGRQGFHVLLQTDGTDCAEYSASYLGEFDYVCLREYQLLKSTWPAIVHHCIIV